jgi:succinate-semialdehyde dehydrogenase/glutarate-semialdehyde dehydrogenase
MTIHAKSVDRSVLELKNLSLLVGRGYVASVWINAPDSKGIKGLLELKYTCAAGL